MPATVAKQVEELIRRSYDGRYPHAFSAEKLRHEVEYGLIKSHIVYDHTGRVLAHASVTSIDGVRGAVTRLVAAQDAGSRGLGTRVAKLAVNDACADGYSVIEARTFLNGDRARRIFKDTLGFIPVGLRLGDRPDVFNTGAREGGVLFARIEDPRVKAIQEVFVSDKVRPIVKRIHDRAGCTRVYRAAAGRPSVELSENPTLNLLDLDRTQSGHFTFTGRATTAAVPFLLKKWSDHGAVFFSARIPLDSPSAIDQIESLLAMNFRFSSLEPGCPDTITLQVSPKGAAEPAFPDAEINELLRPMG